MKNSIRWILAGCLCAALAPASFAAGMRSAAERIGHDTEVSAKAGAHDLARCSEKTAEGVRKVGSEGLKVMSATVSSLDRGGKKILRFIAG
jgi:hypothetical protein